MISVCPSSSLYWATLSCACLVSTLKTIQETTLFVFSLLHKPLFNSCITLWWYLSVLSRFPYCATLSCACFVNPLKQSKQQQFSFLSLLLYFSKNRGDPMAASAICSYKWFLHRKLDEDRQLMRRSRTCGLCCHGEINLEALLCDEGILVKRETTSELTTMSDWLKWTSLKMLTNRLKFVMWCFVRQLEADGEMEAGRWSCVR